MSEFQKKTETADRSQSISTSYDVTHISVNTSQDPLVIFFGPRNIGKTVALLRLCNYLSKYTISVDSRFRSDREEYQKTIDAFDSLRDNTKFAPAATGLVNFLMLNVNYNGVRVCQVLEAPGEHFFDLQRSKTREFQPYLNSIFANERRKVFIFCFSLGMFEADSEMERYNHHIAEVIKNKMSPKRDSIIFLCTKVNKPGGYIRDGKPIDSSFRKELYSQPGFNLITETIKKSHYRKVPLVLFSSGDFTEDASGQKVFVMSPDFYPENLWARINESLSGGKSLWTQIKSILRK